MKLMIIGSPGTGKTSLARQIQEIRDLPLLHLDSIFHKISDEKEAREQLERTMLEFMRSHEEWIIDGNYGDSLELRFKEADTVVWLKSSPMITLYRVLKRSLAFRKNRASRPEMPDEFQEHWDKEYLDFLYFVWTYARKHDARVESLLENFSGHVWILKSQRDKVNFLHQLQGHKE